MMPGTPQKTHRVRVRAIDGKPREWRKLKAQLGAHLDVIDAKDKIEFIICGITEKQIDQVRSKLGGAGLEVIEGGDTAIAAPTPPSLSKTQRRDGPNFAHGHQPRPTRQAIPVADSTPLPGKPYGFVALPETMTAKAPVWHDGTDTARCLSGEIRFELEALTPLLVGWERGQVGDNETDWPLPTDLDSAGRLAEKKSVLCPLRAPWGKRPVVIPSDSLKGLLRHELGALLGAPMERVAERSYSYRPNALFTRDAGAKRIARIARVPSDGITMKALDATTQVRVPTRLELLPSDLRYDRQFKQRSNYYRFDDQDGARYRGGQGAGRDLNSKRTLHTTLTANPSEPTESAPISPAVQDGYLATIRHLTNLDNGHFSERHPDVPKKLRGIEARDRILEAAKNELFQTDDLIWVEWDIEKRRIVSFGWHYYYRWAYTDTVRKRGGTLERRGLFPLDEERTKEGDAPSGLSAVRRLFGYTGDNEGSADIGANDHAQLMGRVFVNSGIEVIGDHERDEDRFLPATFLKELGMPRPSAVEHYLDQPYHPNARPSDNATLVTYGDAVGFDEPGVLAGRKFYLDRPNAVAEDHSEKNKKNDRSTLALEASKPQRKFRFTVRFRDLEADELAAIVIAFCPDQFKSFLGGSHADGYCSKLGYARPLGWGSVRIEAKQLLMLAPEDQRPNLVPTADLPGWVMSSHRKTSTQDAWLAIHRRNHPNAADYPRAVDRDGNENIYTFHTKLRAEHSRNRRYGDAVDERDSR